MIRFLVNILVLGYLFSSCEDYSVLQKERNNLSFYKNIKQPKQKLNSTIKIGTFNIKFGFCQSCNPFSGGIGGGYEQLDKIAELIIELDLDIISLQEVGLDYDHTVVQNQIEYLSTKTGLNYAYGMSRSIQSKSTLYSNGYWGNAILSKFDIISLDNPKIRFIDFYNQNRALKVGVQLDDNRILKVFNSHFESSSTKEEMVDQIDQIINIVKDERDPYIFTGDLNIGYTDEVQYLKPLDTCLINSIELLGVEERNILINTGTFINGSIIDYIFIDKQNFSVLSGKISPLKFLDLSDHFLYWIEVDI